ncbi:hypothetical protein [Paraburkholderia hospita]|uniref:hypothetical protein n=1 Tax=Paraburkholderia hospita TaxID=169430 RepID=UPI000B347F10|nr:hypothetical protein [Paraburkholderia hospita]OUL89767.1 hypothetical protein CA603_18200 [Paraburkholderia hospita]
MVAVTYPAVQAQSALAHVASDAGFIHAPLPQQIIQLWAQDKVLSKKIKQMSMYAHHCACKARLYSDTAEYEKQVQKLSKQKAFHRVAQWGVVVMNVKTAYSFDDERHWRITLRFYPFALAEDPLLMEPVYHDKANNSLDRWLPAVLEPVILRRYNGPGTVDVCGEGDSTYEPLVITIDGDANQPLDVAGAASGIRRILKGSTFNRQFLEVVAHVNAVHAYVHKAIEDGVSTPDIEYEKKRIELQKTVECH